VSVFGTFAGRSVFAPRCVGAVASGLAKFAPDFVSAPRVFGVTSGFATLSPRVFGVFGSAC
jgi:hypothetical protein